MAQEETPEGDPEAKPTKHDEHLEKEIRRRKKLKADLEERDRALAEMKERLSQFEEKEEAMAEAEAKKAQDIEALEKRFNQKLEAERTEKEKLLGEIAERDRLRRQDALLESIASKTGMDNKRHLRAVLVEAARDDDGLDTAPEELDEATIESAVKAMSVVSPELFEPKASVGGSPGGAGLNHHNKGKGEDPSMSEREQQVRKAARFYSGRPDA